MPTPEATEALKNKSQSLADKMNAITSKFDLADELIVEADDVVGSIEEKTNDVELYSSDLELSELDVLNIKNMMADYAFARDTLKENTQNGRRVLNSITLDLLDSDDDKRAALILSFAELNKAVADNMKLYMQSWKEMSNILLNLDKIKKNASGSKDVKTVNNTVNITSTEAISTVDLINRLSGKE